MVNKSNPTNNRILEMENYHISGFAKQGFEAVQEVFIKNFKQNKELGAACCIYYQGEKVVDLWGGIRNKSTGEPWEKDTMTIVYSSTKGLAGLVMALAHSRGLIDYDERVSTYWPEFAQQGKEKITVRQLLSHQAGLYALDEKLDTKLVADLDQLAVVLARQKPVWEAGMRQAYHAITLGFYENEILRRVDPKHRSIGQFFQEEIATPLNLDFYIRLPEEIPNTRLAINERFNQWNAISMIFKTPAFIFSTMNSRSRLRRSLLGSELPELDKDRIYARNLEVPSGGGVGTARAIAQIYGVFATGGKELRLREETLKQLMAPATPPVHGFHDECLKTETRFSLGFTKPNPKYAFGNPSSFGAPGAGGSFGFADPNFKLGYAYIMNKLSADLLDSRNEALRKAMYSSIGVTDPYKQ
ncbi:MAG: beta-lactamase family protein [Asgard group archaeon]|nr:beta-lactamase family protein [Asgard group archaeon]